MDEINNFITILEASSFATKYLKRKISVSNISYLVQYGQIKNYGENGMVLISPKELLDYYNKRIVNKSEKWKEIFGEDLNWALSFDDVPERLRTKHVHRLHPYKGKFIPQLVEYFLDERIDEFKKEVFFKPGDIIIDPFCGSGTTLVQSAELGIDSIGIDVSSFNALISNVKIGEHDLKAISAETKRITQSLQMFIQEKKYIQFEVELLEKLKEFNSVYFPAPDYRYKVRQGEINEDAYSVEKELEFLKIFQTLVDSYGLTIPQREAHTPGQIFINKWYNLPVREEIDFVFSLIKDIENVDVKKVLALILSRTMRSCRATTHNDLATLLIPIHTTYYCKKHYKICKPIFSIVYWWNRYCHDTIKRLSEFKKLRKDSFQHCFVGDSRVIDIESKLRSFNKAFYGKFTKHKAKGIFTSPPYVGLIDYHEQHAYAYDLFRFDRKDELEIGPLFKGQGKEAQTKYVEGVAQVLINSRKWLVDNFEMFIVANDKHGLYPQIFELANMEIYNIYKRPVLNRTEKDKNPYSEMIFHIRG